MIAKWTDGSLYGSFLLAILEVYMKKWNLLKKVGSEAVQELTQQNQFYRPRPVRATPLSASLWARGALSTVTAAFLAARHPDKPSVPQRRGMESMSSTSRYHSRELRQVGLDSPNWAATETPWASVT